MTYSIIARDPNPGEFGVAVETRYFSHAYSETRQTIGPDGDQVLDEILKDTVMP